MGSPSRRDFLKLLSLMPGTLGASSLVGPSGPSGAGNPHNIIVLVLDAWSASHLALYGYGRQTMPNLEQFASRATVYHRHYSEGTFTVPGTASLLTGLSPWTHRALALGGEITSKHRDHQVFHVLSGSHFTLGFSQNQFADLLLSQADGDLNRRLPAASFSLQRALVYSSDLFTNDPRGAHASFEKDIFRRDTGGDASLFLSPLRSLVQWRATRALNQEYLSTYPKGLPASPDLFRLEDVVDGVLEILGNLHEPCFAYVHLFPPHGDYAPRRGFDHLFEDSSTAPRKPDHPLVTDAQSYSRQENQRRDYDQYLASWDSELSRLFEYLESSGLTDTSYIFVTSDHGELIERGVIGHFTPLIYEPLVHVPLIVSQPGQTERVDIRTVTGNMDILPTIASLAGGELPAWAEGRLLPGFGGIPDEDRSMYSMDAKTNSAFGRLERLSMSLLKHDHRLTLYRYPDSHYEEFELYDLASDPEEMIDLYPAQPALAGALRDELLDKIAEVNRLFVT